jgi:hypothetical protein
MKEQQFRDALEPDDDPVYSVLSIVVQFVVFLALQVAKFFYWGVTR